MSDDLPRGWAACEMGEISKVVGGGTPDSQDPNNFSTNSGIPWVTPADLSDNEAIYVRRGRRFLTKAGFENSSARLLPKGAVLFSSRAPIGYVAVAANEISTNQGFKSFACADGIFPEYVYFWLRFATPLAEELASGTTFAEISGKNAARIPLRLAPTAEQRRIVAKLEVLLGKVDGCQRRLAKIPVLLKRFRQSVLAAACSGRLTADWREENHALETGDELLKKILEYRAIIWRRSGRKGACPSAPLTGKSGLPELPQGWSWIPLGVLGENPFETVQTGPFGALLHKEEFAPIGVPVVAVGNLTGMGFTKEGLYFVSTKKAEQLSRFDIQAGDVLFARSGATLGKVCIAPPEAKDWRMTGHILRARLKRNYLLPGYCVFALRGDPAVTRQIFGSVQGTTRPGYNTALLESIELPVPPLPEQHEIVRRVEALFALADRIEARFAKAKAQVDRLTPSLLARAFAGKLVPQDPNDEPAEKLLERIRAAKGDKRLG